MQLLHRIQSSHQFDCLSINWKWIFTMCCSFPDGSQNLDVNKIEEKRLLSTMNEAEEVYGSVNVSKKMFDETVSISSSIAQTEEDQKNNEKDLEDPPMVPELDYEEKCTIVAEDFGQRGEASKILDENLSDYSDGRIKVFGTVVVVFGFELMQNTLTIDISELKGLPKVEGPPHYQLFVKIFSESGRALKKWHSPMFLPMKVPKNQRVEYSDMSAKDIRTTAIRMRLYSCERKRRDKLVSESIIGLRNVHFKDKYQIKMEQREKIKLKDRSERTDDDEEDALPESSKKFEVKIEEPVCNQQELQVGLCYNPITGRMTVEIIKGNAFINPSTKDAAKLPNPFVKVSVCDKKGEQIAKSKTTVRQSQANPLFKETFIFQVNQCQLNEVTVLIGVYHKKSASRKEIIGWSSVGMHSSSDNEAHHWTSMKDNKGEMMRQWHLLQQNTKSKDWFSRDD